MGNITKAYYGDISLYGCHWDEVRTIWPHRDFFTGKRIKPFTMCARARRIAGGQPTSILYLSYVAYWTTPSEFTMQKLKGNV